MTQKCLIFMKNDPKFLRTPNVSGNFVTKLHHYLQVCPLVSNPKVLCYKLTIHLKDVDSLMIVSPKP